MPEILPPFSSGQNEHFGIEMETEDGYVPKNILVTGGDGFMYLKGKRELTHSASHVVTMLVKKYPDYNIVNVDCLDYCATRNNLKEVENYPNYSFEEVSGFLWVQL